MSGNWRLEIAADLDNLKLVRDFIEEIGQLAGLDQGRTGELVLAVDEVVTNIVTHGCASNDCHIELEIQARDQVCSTLIRDDGQLFDPTGMLEPDLQVSPLDRSVPGGYGVYLVRHLVDETRYRVTPDGRNELTLLKRNH